MRKVGYVIEGEIYPDEGEPLTIFEEMTASELVIESAWVTVTISEWDEKDDK